MHDPKATAGQLSLVLDELGRLPLGKSIVPPTSQNQARIERDLIGLAITGIELST